MSGPFVYRPIEISAHIDSDGTGYIVAECKDETTSIMSINAGPEPFALLGIHTEDQMDKAIRGELGRELVRDHLTRCRSCQKALPANGTLVSARHGRVTT